MRTYFALASILAAIAPRGYCQGLVNFNNRVTSVSPVIDAPVYYQCTSADYRMDGTDMKYRAALLGGPTSAVAASFNHAGTLQMLASPTSGNTWVTFRTGGAAGYVAVGLDSARNSGLPYGSMGMFQIVAWYGTETNWQTAFDDWTAGMTLVGFSDPVIVQVSTNASDSPKPLTGLQPTVLTWAWGGPGLIIDAEPTSQAVPLGGTASLQGYARGENSSGFRLQWQFNGVDIPGAIYEWLTITNIGFENAGLYRFVASNYCTAATSYTAMIVVKSATLASKGLGPEGFRIQLTGTTGTVFQVQASSNLSNWGVLGNFTNQSGSLMITDQTATTVLQRFYRAVLP